MLPERSVIRPAALVALLVGLVACSDRVSPTAPTSSSSSTTAATPHWPPRFPPLTGPARVYEFLNAPLPPAQYTQQSRIVLYDDGTFALQYAGLGEYRGTYSEADGLITFNWEGWSAAGPWGATGTLLGDTLRVSFNIIMQLTDFEDAVYVLVR